MEELLREIIAKLDRQDERLERIETKIDAVYEQVAKNTETENELAATVQDHETDIRMIKRILTNQ